MMGKGSAGEELSLSVVSVLRVLYIERMCAGGKRAREIAHGAV